MGWLVTGIVSYSESLSILHAVLVMFAHIPLVHINHIPMTTINHAILSFAEPSGLVLFAIAREQYHRVVSSRQENAMEYGFLNQSRERKEAQIGMEARQWRLTWHWSMPRGPWNGWDTERDEIWECNSGKGNALPQNSCYLGSGTVRRLMVGQDFIVRTIRGKTKGSKPSTHAYPWGTITSDSGYDGKVCTYL